MDVIERKVDEEAQRLLIDGLRRNDRESLANIYDAYSPIAYGFALKTLGSAGEAEDVVQESFLALWRQADRLDPKKGVRSYLLTIVHNKSIDRLRRQGRKRESALDLEAPMVSEAAGPEEIASLKSEQDAVRSAMKALSEEQRLAVEMTYFNGMTINEAAQRLKVPIGTVKSRLRLALGHMRQRLGEA